MVHTLDLRFLDETHTIASFLLESDDGLILVESGPYSTFDHLEQVLKAKGAHLADVRHVLLTHIHLDHAGAAWALARQGAKIYVHPFGYKHLAHPEKLWASAKRIYGDQMEYLWGDMQPIDEAQLVAVEDRARLAIGGRRFLAHHTPGHAVHHIAWQYEDIVFTGDVAGVKIDDYIVAPPCPPPDINIEDWKRSIDRVIQLKPTKIYLTHFGPVEDVESHMIELLMRLNKWAAWIYPYFQKGTPAEEIVPLFQQFSMDEMKFAGVPPAVMERYLKANPPWMSVWGLLRYFKQKQ